MKKRNGTIQFILTLLISVIFVSGLANAQQTEVTKNAQIIPKKVPSVKKETQNIRPGDVYPGDAAVAGYQEVSVFGSGGRKYQIEDKKRKRTYIFSEVEGHWPADNYGYFRVLDYYGYGREQEDKREHLIFASRMPMPGCKDPVKPDCGDPLRRAGEFVALFMADTELFAVYNPVTSFGSGELSYLYAYVPEQDITDIEGDGNLEIRAFIWLKTDAKRLSVPITRVMAIYQYIEHDKNCGCSKFVRVKGRAYEKIYVEYANKMKKEKKIIAWLAAVESTENPELIKTALGEFKNLPSPDHNEKQSILEMLINNGFSGLKTSDKNP